MSKTQVLLTTLCLAVGAAAVAGAVTVETIPVVSMPGPTAVRTPPPPAPVAAPPAATPVLANALAPAPAPAAESAREARPSLSVPDFKGKRLSVARREGRKLGLVVSARDDYGQRVAGDVAPYYRVRRQITEAGTLVDPGAAVEVRVREIESPSGY